jgi:hypothetical protein
MNRVGAGVFVTEHRFSDAERRLKITRLQALRRLRPAAPEGDSRSGRPSARLKAFPDTTPFAFRLRPENEIPSRLNICGVILITALAKEE